jgi:hypothetical protein
MMGIEITYDCLVRACRKVETTAEELVEELS